MSSLAQRETGPFTLPFGGAFHWVVRGIEGITRAYAGRRMLNDLARADDRMLRDIGLNRSDLRDAAAEPLYRDPTEVLAGRVEGAQARHRVGNLKRSPADEVAELMQRLKSRRFVPYY